jgi:K+-sensing histidine kinase KdpD
VTARIRREFLSPTTAMACQKSSEPFLNRSTELQKLAIIRTGLGLSIAQRIAIIHGGSICAHNRDGGGLEMEIRLPIQTNDRIATTENETNESVA